jgi:hypothetical protein
MKKMMLVVSVMFVVAGSLSSCCKTCTKPGQNNITVCRDNYSSEADYNDAIAVYTLLGYDCK